MADLSLKYGGTFDKVLCDKKRIINFLSKFRRRRILFDVAIDYFDIKVKIKKGKRKRRNRMLPLQHIESLISIFLNKYKQKPFNCSHNYLHKTNSSFKS